MSGGTGSESTVLPFSVWLSSALVLLVLIGFSCAMAGVGTGYSRSFNLRQWERLFLQGEASLYAGRYDAAIRELEQSAKYAENADKRGVALATTLGVLGRTYVQSGNANKAIECYAKAVAIMRENVARPSQKLSFCQFELACYLGQLGAQHLRMAAKGAAPELAESIALFRALGAQGAHDQLLLSDYADTLASAMTLAASVKDESAVKEYYKELSAPGLSASCWPATTNLILRNYASVLRESGSAGEASNLFVYDKWRSAMTKGRTASKGKNHNLAIAQEQATVAVTAATENKNAAVSLAESESLLGEIFQRKGDQPSAREHYQRAWQSIKAGDSDATRDNIALRLTKLDLFAPRITLEPEMKQLLALREKPGRDKLALAEALVLCACVYDLFGDLERSNRYAHKAQSILENDTSNVSSVSLNCEFLGDLSLCQGYGGRAKALYLKAVKVYEWKRQMSPVRESVCSIRLGLVELLGGNKEGGNAAFSRATELVADNGGYRLNVARAMAFLLTDLREHKRVKCADALATLIGKLISVSPASPQEQAWKDVAVMSLGPLGTAPKRVVGKIKVSEWKHFPPEARL